LAPRETLTPRVGSVAGVAPATSRCSSMSIKPPCYRPRAPDRAPGVLLLLPWAGRALPPSRVMVRWQAAVAPAHLRLRHRLRPPVTHLGYDMNVLPYYALLNSVLFEL
jgi:hypothetical protein